MASRYEPPAELRPFLEELALMLVEDFECRLERERQDQALKVSERRQSDIEKAA